MSSPPLAALTIKPPAAEPFDPLAQAGKVMSLKAMMTGQQEANLQLEEKKRILAENQAVRDAIASTNGDIKAALPNIAKVAPEKAAAYKKQIDEWDTADITKKKAMIELNGKKLERMGQIAGSITDQTSYTAALDQAMKEGVIDQGTYHQLSDQPYDPAVVKQFQTQALTAKEQLDSHFKELERTDKLAKEKVDQAHAAELEKPVIERNFQSDYKRMLAAKDLKPNAKLEYDFKKEWEKKQAELKKTANTVDLTTDAIEVIADNMIAGAPMPSLGMGNPKVRAQILNRMAEKQIASGGSAGDIAEAQAAYNIAKSPAQLAFFGSANSLLDKGGTIDQLTAQGAKIPQGQFPVLNTIDDWQKTARGKGPLAGFAATALGVADDYSKVMGGGQGSDTSRKQALDIIAAALSPEQRAEALSGIRGAVRSQRDSRIGKNKLLKKMYGGTEESAPAAGGGKIEVTAPNGKTYSFGDQASADKFKAAAGIK